MTEKDVLTVTIKYNGRKLRFDSEGENAKKDYTNVLKALSDEKDENITDYTQSL